MLNLFLAILLGNFDEASIMMKEKKYIEENIKQKRTMMNAVAALENVKNQEILEPPKIQVIGNTENINDPFMEEEKKLAQIDNENIETERKLLEKDQLETNFEKQISLSENNSSSSFDSSFSLKIESIIAIFANRVFKLSFTS